MTGRLVGRTNGPTMLIAQSMLLAVTMAFTPHIYGAQCQALLARNLPAYAATLAPTYRFIGQGGKTESRAQILAIYAHLFQTKNEMVESCRASAPSLSASADVLPVHIIESVAISIPMEGVRRYRIDLHAIERWELVQGRWQAVEGIVQSRTVTAL